MGRYEKWRYKCLYCGRWNHAIDDRYCCRICKTKVSGEEEIREFREED